MLKTIIKCFVKLAIYLFKEKYSVMFFKIEKKLKKIDQKKILKLNIILFFINKNYFFWNILSQKFKYLRDCSSIKNLFNFFLTFFNWVKDDE